MSVRRFLEKDILIRLNEDGFVETTRYIGLPRRFAAYEICIHQPAETAHPAGINLDLEYEPISVRRAGGRYPGGAAGG
jgi:hypothetical protein